MNDTERLDLETKNLERLKSHLTAVLSLRPIEELTPLSVSILKASKRFTDEIGAWMGSLSMHEGLDTAFCEILEAMKVNCTSEQVEVIEIALESFTWASEAFEDFPISVAPYLHGDEVSWAWDFLFMSDDQIMAGDASDGVMRRINRRRVLYRFAKLGIDVFGLGHKRK